MKRVHFPNDEAGHPSRTEWWYYNGFLKASDNSEYGIMLTFFRIDLAKNKLLDVLPTRTKRLVYPFIEGRIVNAHISDLGNKRFYPHYIHHGKLPLITHISSSEMDVRFGRDVARKHKKHQDIKFSNGKEKIQLKLKSLKKPVLWGKRGVIPMGTKGDSYYYSFTNMKASGTLTVRGSKKKVKGTVWLDHQWGEWDLFNDKWTWLSIQLSDSTEIMVFDFKNIMSSERIAFAGLVDKGSRTVMLKKLRLVPVKYWKSPVSGKKYAVEWKLFLPERKIALNIRAFFPEQEMTDPRTPPYYEGACIAHGTVGRREVTGRAYLEIADFSQKWIRRKYGQ